MNKSFYHFLMKYRHAIKKDELSEFANAAYHDHEFPKSSDDYHLLSNYLELNGHYIANMSLFDYAWDLYVEAENK
ncbi:YozE family protein [Lederbergia lenta]|uniref:UPF0346 protein NCTC4824_02030 n=1 Tax=Lederbergia lenta TaxID=1467 RepID=A0A2X4WHA9_LEDLE|nr:YozE family protein [Lederbergia lenta]MCM3109353.1 YozE family protein [Lederbergia lenta]MEC2324881.1 YozE family protein [Lederbergia lenta]SQI56950.1 Protein of uncharacterised function (DUF1250) [Lederbergia lenta]